MFFFSPLCEFLLLVSPQFSENGEKDGSSAECSSSTGNLESVMLAVIALHSSIFLLLLLQEKVLFQMLELPFRRHEFSICIWESWESFSPTNEKHFS